MLLDLRYLLEEFAPGYAFEYHWRFYDYEQYFVLVQEFITTLILSIVVVISVILVISSNFKITMMVCLCVLMTDIFLAGLIHYWGLTFNPIVMIQIVLAIGTSVDFSAHIAHAYLIEVVPKKKERKFTDSQIRQYKATMALSKMGSSVFHGGFSTFVAISVLAPAKTYITIAFYRLWFGIILFGLANGFFLLPVILSFIGPTETVIDPTLF